MPDDRSSDLQPGGPPGPASTPWWLPRQLPGLPDIGRGRGFRLYDRHGRRYLDLYQSAGWAVLGHRPAGLIKEMKRTLSRAAPPGTPSRHYRHVEHAARSLFPGWGVIRVYSSVHEALQCLGISPWEVGEPTVAAGGSPAADGSATVGGNAAAGRSSTRLRLWRPYVPVQAADSAGGVERDGRGESIRLPILAVIPVPSWPSPVIVCFPESSAEADEAGGAGELGKTDGGAGGGTQSNAAVPGHRAVSPFLLAGLAHSLQQLIRAGVDPGSHFVGEPQKPNASPKLRARVEDGEAAAHGQPPSGPAWWHFEHPFWIVRGPYIYPRCEPIHYQRVYEHFLAGGVVLHPRYPGPSILPRQWSHGEYRRVIRLSDDAVKLVEG